MAKDLITKSEDPYLALLSYRSMPLYNGYTPAELLMGKKLRSTHALAPEKLTPRWPETEQLRKVELEYKHKQAKNYNWWHRASVLPALKPGEKVWVTDRSAPAVIVQKSPEPFGTWLKPTNPFCGERGDNWLKPQPLLLSWRRKRWPAQVWKFQQFHGNSFRQNCYSAKTIGPSKIGLGHGKTLWRQK